MTLLRTIGLMSGTSLDGVDAALVESDGEVIHRLGPTGYRPYADEERALLRGALADAVGLSDRAERPGRLAEAEAMVTAAHAEAVEALLAAEGIERAGVDAVGFHGQTVVHRPAERLTVQVGDAGALARRLGLRVVHDLRAADVAAGGQGAPLVPVFHRALVAASDLPRPVAVLNVGGVANLTLVGEGDRLIAFDVGPGGALIDDLMLRRAGRPLDDGGRVAARGKADEALLAWLLVHPFFARPPPKSLDRDWFSASLVGHLSTEDGAATLTAFTARAAARALDHLPERPQRWVVCGGGARNGELLRLLGRATGAEVVTADGQGWSSAFLEAQAFAFLAARTLRGLPITYPGTTGAPAPLTGGVVSEP